MKIAIVILNWNGKELLEKFLPSVIAHSKEQANIYVADNASTDASVDFVKMNFPEVSIIQNKENEGYAKGYNNALKNLSEEIFVLLNSDVEVTQNWLSPMISEFNLDKKMVAAQPKILDFKNKEFFEYAGAAGGFIDALGYPFCRGRIFGSIEKDFGQYHTTAPIFWASGACFFVRNKSFWDTAGFDEDFFAHQEEIDLCWRLQANGGVIKYVGTSEVYHVGGATLSSGNPKKTYYNFRNTLLLLLKNNKNKSVYFLIAIRLGLDGLAGIQFLFQGKPRHTLAIFRAHLSFYRMIPKFLKKRKRMASTFAYYHQKSIVWEYFVRGKKRFQNKNYYLK